MYCNCFIYFFLAIVAFLVGVLVADFSGVQNVGSGLGFTLTVGGVSASIGTPIGGKLSCILGHNRVLGSCYFCSHGLYRFQMFSTVTLYFILTKQSCKYFLASEYDMMM